MVSLIKSILILSLAVPNSLDAQDSTATPKIYTGISNYVLEKGHLEFNFQNALSSFIIESTRGYGMEDIPMDRLRATQSNHLFRVYFGTSPNRKWDAGIALRYSQARLDDRARNSPLEIFKGNGGLSQEDLQRDRNFNFRGLSMLGLRTRWMPFDNIPELSIQGLLDLPILGNRDLKKLLNTSRLETGLNATYYHELFNSTFLFFDAGWRSFWKSNILNKTEHQLGLSAYWIFTLNNGNFHLFPGITYNQTFQQANGLWMNSVNNQLFGGIGLLYQPRQEIGFFLNGQFPLILNSGSEEVIWIKESFSALAFGIRVVI